MATAMAMVTAATILLTRRDNVVRLYKENPAANNAAGFFLHPSMAVDGNREGGQRRPRQRTARLDADQAIGDDANDAADQGGVDDVPLSPEDSTEYH